MEDYDADILKKRAALAKNGVKLGYAMLEHPTHARIGEAYISAIVEKLPNPAGDFRFFTQMCKVKESSRTYQTKKQLY